MMLQRVNFSAVTTEDLEKIGVKKKPFDFDPEKLAELIKGITTNAEAEIADLQSQIKKIYASVDMDVRLILSTF